MDVDVHSMYHPPPPGLLTCPAIAAGGEKLGDYSHLGYGHAVRN